MTIRPPAPLASCELAEDEICGPELTRVLSDAFATLQLPHQRYIVRRIGLRREGEAVAVYAAIQGRLQPSTLLINRKWIEKLHAMCGKVLEDFGEDASRGRTGQRPRSDRQDLPRENAQR